MELISISLGSNYGVKAAHAAALYNVRGICHLVHICIFILELLMHTASKGLILEGSKPHSHKHIPVCLVYIFHFFHYSPSQQYIGECIGCSHNVVEGMTLFDKITMHCI